MGDDALMACGLGKKAREEDARPKRLVEDAAPKTEEAAVSLLGFEREEEEAKRLELAKASLMDFF